MYDAIVVGARCAGSSTARLLAVQGRRVLVVDRATFPSDTLSTHCIDPAGIVTLGKWGILDRVMATNAPPLTRFVLTAGGAEYPADAPIAITAPRRTVLDKLLLDIAAGAAVEVREGVTVKDLLRDEDGTVVGIAGDDADGNAFEERAAIVIGADGVHSFVARAVGAKQYDIRHSAGSGYYAYYAGTRFIDVELAFEPSRFAGIFPTNDGEACVFAGRTGDEFRDMRNDPDASVIETLAEVNQRIADMTAEGTRTSRFFKYDTQPGFYRTPTGPGWALVGDAGFHIDPVTGRGIGHAFLSADILARAIDNDALDSYQQERDELTRPMYELTQEIAALEWDASRLIELMMSVSIETMRVCQLAGSAPV